VLFPFYRLGWGHQPGWSAHSLSHFWGPLLFSRVLGVTFGGNSPQRLPPPLVWEAQCTTTKATACHIRTRPPFSFFPISNFLFFVINYPQETPRLCFFFLPGVYGTFFPIRVLSPDAPRFGRDPPVSTCSFHFSLEAILDSERTVRACSLGVSSFQRFRLSLLPDLCPVGRCIKNKGMASSGPPLVVRRKLAHHPTFFGASYLGRQHPHMSKILKLFHAPFTRATAKTWGFPRPLCPWWAHPSHREHKNTSVFVRMWLKWRNLKHSPKPGFSPLSARARNPGKREFTLTLVATRAEGPVSLVVRISVTSV